MSKQGSSVNLWRATSFSKKHLAKLFREIRCASNSQVHSLESRYKFVTTTTSVYTTSVFVLFCHCFCSDFLCNNARHCSSGQFKEYRFNAFATRSLQSQHLEHPLGGCTPQGSYDNTCDSKHGSESRGVLRF